MRRLLIRSLKALALLVLVVIAAVAAGGAALQTQAGKDFLASRLTAALSTPNAGVAIGRITGRVPFDMSIDQVQVSDAAGRWLTLRSVHFAMAPRELLQRRLRILELAAAELHVERLPAPRLASTPPPKPAGPPGLPEVPHLPVAVALDRLAIDLIRLDTAVLGEPASLSLDGDAAIAGGAATVRLAARRIDEQPGRAILDLALAGVPAVLRLDLDVAEPGGLLLGRALGRDDRPALAARLFGEGPLADWHGSFSASAGDLAGIEAEIGLAVAGATQMTLRGDARIARLLPPGLAPLVESGINFDLAATAKEDGGLALERLAIVSTAARLSGTGTLGAAPATIAGHVDIAAEDLSRFAALAGGATGGTLQLGIDLAGTAERPEATVTLRGDALRYEQHRADSAEARIAARTTAPLDDPAMRVEIEAEGRFASIASDAASVPPGLAEALTWRVAGSSDRAVQRVELHALTVQGAGLDVSAHGTASDGLKTIDGSARLAAELEPLSGLAGEKLAGRIHLDVDATADSSTTAMTLRLAGGGEGLVTSIPALDAALGGRLSLDGAIDRAADGAIRVERLAAETAALSLTGAGMLEPGDSRLAAELRLDVPDLKPLAAALGHAGAGGLSLSATASGTRAAPALEARLEARRVALDAARLDDLAATLAVAGLDAPEGKLSASFRSAELRGTLDGEFRLGDAMTTLDLKRLRLAANGTTLDAALRVALDTLLASGTVTAKVPDLAPWSALAGQRLAGRAELKATLGDKDGQSVDLSASATNLSTRAEGAEPVALGRLSVNARLTDLLGRPGGRAQAEVAGAKAPGAEFRSLKLRGESAKDGAIRFSVEVDGKILDELTMAANGDARFGPDAALDLRLAKLAGRFAGTEFGLRKMLTLHRRGSDLAFENLALGLGSGEIAGSGSLRGQAVAAKLTGRQLPLAVVGRAAGTELGGTLGFELALDGTMARPQGRLRLDGRELRYAPTQRAALPPLRLVAEASLRGERGELRGRVDGPKGDSVGFSGGAPIRLALRPFAVALPPDGAIAFKLEGDGELGNLADLLPLGEDKATGHFHLDLAAGGTVAAPTAAGRMTLANGRYENLAMGTVISDIAIDLSGSRDRLVLTRLTARDGGRGELSAQGGVILSATPGPTFDVSASLRRFTAVRRDDATAVVSGEAKVTGTLAQPAVTARMRVDEAELRVPEKSAAEVKKLDVVRIDSRTGKVLSPPAAENRRDPALTASLDIVVDLPGQTFVRGRGLDSEWRGRLRIAGTSAAPAITGQIESVRGTFAFIGKTLRITRGVIAFDGGAKIDPTLDILTQANASGMIAQVQISGTASRPTIQLSSDPPLPQDEVLAQLLFGKGLGQITPAQGIQLAAAASSLASGGPGILDRIRGRLGLDRLDIGSSQDPTIGSNPLPGGSASNAGATSSAGSASVSAGKYVAEGVYVGVDQSISGQSRARVEVEVTPHITVETDVGGQGRSGIGLNWKMDY